MPGWAARATALGPSVGRTRGARFALRQDGGDMAKVADLRDVPAWLVAAPEERRRLATAVAVLRHRPAIDAELRGEVLAPVAATTGEALFDALCALSTPADAVTAPLPPVTLLGQIGERLLRESLPAKLGGRDDAGARALVGIAARAQVTAS